MKSINEILSEVLGEDFTSTKKLNELITPPARMKLCGYIAVYLLFNYSQKKKINVELVSFIAFLLLMLRDNDLKDDSDDAITLFAAGIISILGGNFLNFKEDHLQVQRLRDVISDKINSILDFTDVNEADVNELKSIFTIMTSPNEKNTLELYDDYLKKLDENDEEFDILRN